MNFSDRLQLKEHYDVKVLTWECFSNLPDFCNKYIHRYFFLKKKLNIAFPSWICQMNGMNKKLTFGNTRSKMRYEFIPNNPGEILLLHLENFFSTQQILR